MVIPVIVISLARSRERRDGICAHLEEMGIPFSFFDAIDGQTMSEADVAALRPINQYAGQNVRSLSPSEIGCAASHWEVAKQIACGTEQFVCVLEDDAKLLPGAPHFLNEEFLHQLPSFDALRLVNDRNRTRSLSKLIGYHHGREICAPLRPGFRTTAQIYSREGAAKIAKGLVPLLGPVDNVIYADVRIHGLRVLEVRPSVVVPQKWKSTVQNRAPSRPHTPGSLLRKKAFLLARFVRTIRSFVRAWGLVSMFRLARCGPPAVTQ